MSFSVTILLTLGSSGSTYNIYECVGDVCEITPISGSPYTIVSDVPVTVNGIDVGTTSLKIEAIGTCTNSVIIPIQNLPTPTPTPTVSPSPTPTIGSIPPTPTPTPTIGSIPPTPTPTPSPSVPQVLYYTLNACDIGNPTYDTTIEPLVSNQRYIESGTGDIWIYDGNAGSINPSHTVNGSLQIVTGFAGCP